MLCNEEGEIQEKNVVNAIFPHSKIFHENEGVQIFIVGFH